MRDGDLNGVIVKNKVHTLDDFADHDELYESLGINNNTDKYIVFRQTWGADNKWRGDVEICGKTKKVNREIPIVISYMTSLGYLVKITGTDEYHDITTITLAVTNV